VVAVAAVVALAWRPARRGEAILVAVVAAGAGLLVSIAKPIVGRVRPPEQYRLVTEANQSFPSGHSVASIAIITVIVVVLVSRISSRGRRTTVIVIGAAFVALIGVSRLYLGVHWPTDVAGGWFTGLGWLLLCLTIRRVWRTYPIVVRIHNRELFHHIPLIADRTDRAADTETHHGKATK
jgi:undecaprenyl-diphosphatase